MHSIIYHRDHKHHSSQSPARKEYYSFGGPMSSPKVSPSRHQQRRLEKEELQGEFKKLNPPTFDGENKKDKYVESCLLGMIKYFQLYHY